jgi:alpha-glucosidase
MIDFFKTLEYAVNVRSYINLEAVFSDETENFVTPSEPKLGELVSIRLRTGSNNVDGVFFHYAQSAKEDSPSVLPMKKESTIGLFDYYLINITASKSTYYFSLVKDGRVYYYNKRGLYKDLDPVYHFVIIPNFITPAWAKGAIMYQIFTDRFYNGNLSNDVVNNEYIYLGKPARLKERWDEPINLDDFCSLYGCDLQGIIQKLDYLLEIGVEVIYLNPVFVSPSSHKYDIQDYDYVDPHFGEIVKESGEPLRFEKFHNRHAKLYVSRTTDIVNLAASNRVLAKLIELAHERGIRIILDGVFNHCGAFSKWMDKEHFYSSQGYPSGAYFDENSPYHNYFKWYDKNWPNNDCYDGWWGYDNHPKLNYEASENLYQYMLNIGRKWVSPPYNADGWRLDVAADLGFSEAFNHKFWKDFRAAVKEANPEAIILAEHYGDPKNWLQGDEWDTIMNYDAFMEPITWFLTGMEKHSETFEEGKLSNAMAFEGSMQYYMARMTLHSLQSSINELSNHDHSRFLTRTSMKVGRLHTNGCADADTGINLGIMYEAVVFQMTWPGSPTIYYGDEVGLTGWSDPDNRRTYPWGRENTDLLSFHKVCIGLRKKYQAIRTGSVLFLYNDHGIISYGRWDNEQRIAVIINNNATERTLRVPVWKMECDKNGKMAVLLESSNDKWSCSGRLLPVIEGCVSVEVGGYGAIVLQEGNC